MSKVTCVTPHACTVLRALMLAMLTAIYSPHSGDAEQPPAPCHPHPNAVADRAAVASRGDIVTLPQPLQDRLIQLADRPHTYLPMPAFAEADGPSQVFQYSIAERSSFPFFNVLEMFTQPRSQPCLNRWSQTQNQVHKGQRLKYLKIPTRIHNDMGPLATELLQGYRLARLVGKACPRMRITKEMIQTIAQQYTQKIKHNLTIACGRELL